MYDPCNVYRGRYKEFIEGIKVLRPLNEILEGSENHHIIPKCTVSVEEIPVIDTGDYRINLLYREHLIAHKILAEDNPTHKGLVHAFWRMCNGKVKVCTSEEYEEARSLHSSVLSETMQGDGNPNYNTRVVNNGIDQHHVRLEDIDYYKSIGYEEGALPKTDLARKHISESLLGKPCSESKKQKLSESQNLYLETHQHQRVGKTHTEESKDKIAEKASERMKGIGNPMYGKYGSDHPAYGCVHSEEGRRVMSERMKGNPSNTGKKCINDGLRNYFKPKKDIPYYLSIGYKEGRI